MIFPALDDDPSNKLWLKTRKQSTHTLLKDFTAAAKEQAAVEFFLALSAQSGKGKYGIYWIQRNRLWMCFQISAYKAHVLGGDDNLNQDMPVQAARELYKKMLSEGWKSADPTTQGMNLQKLTQLVEKQFDDIDKEPDSLAKLAELLKTTEKNANLRAMKMRLTPVCSRCGGTGHYSFNGTHSICYRCNGDKVDPVNKKNLPSVINAAKQAAAEGKVDTYIRGLQAKKSSNGGKEKVMQAYKNSLLKKVTPSHFKREEDYTPIEAEAARLNAEKFPIFTELMDLWVKLQVGGKDVVPEDYLRFNELVDLNIKAYADADAILKKMM